MPRLLGGGTRGNFLETSFVPTSTFKDLIDGYITAKTQVTGRKFKLAWGANYQVDRVGDGEIANGMITDYEKTSSSYSLIGILWCYEDQNGVVHPVTGIVNLAYSGTFALQDSIIENGTTAIAVDDGGTGGWGAVIGLDTPASSRADILV